MAFPTVEGISATAFNANTAAPAVPYPTVSGGILADDILLLLWSEDGTGASVTDWGGFTELDQGAAGPASHGLAWTRAVGGESGTVTLATAAPTGAAPVPPGSERQTAIMYCIRGAHTTSAPEISTAATGTSSSADAGSLSPSWGAEDNLWIVSEGNDAEVIGSAAPTNYTDLTTIACTTSGAATSTCRRELNAASEDPGAMTLSGSETWRAYTIAIRPAPAGGPSNQTISVGQATEADTAQAVTAVPGGVTVAVGQATETDTAQAITPAATVTVQVGQATETDTAQAITPVVGGVTIAVGQAVETDTARAITVISGGAPAVVPTRTLLGVGI